MMEPETIQKILSVDMFEGDFGSPGDKILSDKIVKARKVRPCFLCGNDIDNGSKIRTLSAVFDGKLMSYAWCNLCCMAMAMCYTDSGKELERRASLRRKNELD